ncbi:MAG: hypothetical protein AB7O97_00570 [Planctomycetota bacterium]
MTKRSVATFLLAVLPWAVAPAAAQTLQLADGQVLLAKVEDAYGEGLRVHRLDNGGVLELTWEHLSPDCAMRIKREYALAGQEEGEPMATAHEVRYVVGGVAKVLIGRIVDDGDPKTMVLLVKGVPYRIPRENITGVRQIEVPVSQVHTPDEYYALKLAELTPGEEADLHKLLAEELMKVRDYARARTHLETAKRLGNSREPERVATLLKRVELYIEAGKERELLDDLQVATARAQPRDFATGRELIAKYEKEFKNGKLRSDFEQDQRRFEEARTRFYAQKVADAWRRVAITYVADKKMQEALTLGAAKEYAETRMSDDIAAYVAQRLELEAEEVDQLFAIRDKYPVGRRSEHFSYGIGSWVLGEPAILKDTKQGAEEDKPTDNPADDRELERIRKAIQKMMEQRRNAGRGAAGGSREQTDDEWWAAADRQERTGWLRAYYAEFGGKLQMVGAYVQPCFACAALGTQTEMDPQTNKPVKVPCYLCHGTKWLRTFKAY